MRRRTYAIARRWVAGVSTFAIVIALAPLHGSAAEDAAPTSPFLSGALDINQLGHVVGFRDTGGGTRGFFWRGGRPVDVGTLGGTNSRANAINDWDEVVGSSQLAGNSSEHAFLWRNGRMTDLGTLGGNFSEATAINNRGDIVGSSTRGDAACPACPHAVLWRRGVTTDLGTPRGLGDLSGAAGVNNRGTVFGFWGRTGEGQRSFVWRSGASIDLGSLGGGFATGFTIATSMNDRNEIVGTSVTASGAHHAFLWRAGALIDLTPNSLVDTTAVAINNRGQVVIDVGVPGTGSERVVVWDRGSITPVSGLGGATHASGINDFGQVTGWSGITPLGPPHAFVWSRGHRARDLGTLGGSSSLPIRAPYNPINNRGEVVGQSDVAGDVTAHAFVWTRERLIDLGALPLVSTLARS